MIGGLLALLAVATAGAGGGDGGAAPPSHQPLRQIMHVQFEPGSAVVRADDGVLLDFIAGVLRAAPDIQVVEVQGFAARNERRSGKLSEARAAAIRAALIARGIAAERLVARGYATTQPLCEERTPTCLARNRRGAFLILRQLESPRERSAAAIHGCWTVTDSGQLTSIKVGQELCLTSTAFAVRDASGALVDGWLVAWTATPEGWRADVEGRDGTTLPVSFDCKLTDDARLAVTGSGGFTKLKAQRASLSSAEHAVEGGATLVESLRDCWRCLREGRDLLPDGIAKDLLDEAFYSLRSCRLGTSALRNALGEGRLPPICKKR
jgi:OmpA family